MKKYTVMLCVCVTALMIVGCDSYSDKITSYDKPQSSTISSSTGKTKLEAYLVCDNRDYAYWKEMGGYASPSLAPIMVNIKNHHGQYIGSRQKLCKEM
jgi:hypothetical protein